MRLQRIFSAICLAAVLFSVSGCTEAKDEKAKYIFLFIGDGMGMTHVASAESYLSYKAGKLGGEQLMMTQFPVFGTATSHSADNQITDSSASGTAIACGEKTNNSAMGVDADGKPVRSMAYDLKDEGYQIGIISTVGINHATPGSFYASSKSRNDYYAISKQIPASGFDYFAGAGFLGFRGARNQEQPTDEYLEENGYTVSYGIEEFKSESAGKEKVIFCQESNREKDADDYVTETVAEDATLSEMLELGMDFFNEDEPFFFMCEGGDIDWGGHDHMTMMMINELLEMDDAIKVAYDFYLEHPDETLIVVTADHETGGMTLGAGPYLIDWKTLEEQWVSGVTLNREENEALNRRASIGWTTGGHTGGPVPVFAIGKGAEKFSGRMDNTEIKGKILN